MTIVVIGNIMEYQSNIKSIIGEISFKIDDDIKIRFYNNNQDIDKEINSHDYKKIYIFDISSDNYDYCLENAYKIRKNDWDSEIILIMNNNTNIIKFKTSIPKVFCYIDKLNSYKIDLQKAINTIINKKYNNKMFIYNTRNSKTSIYYKRIKYIITDKDKRKLLIVSDNGSNYISLCLKDMLKKLDSRFKMVHRCCIVNTERVVQYDFKNGNIVFDNGEKINCLSKKYKDSIVL